MIPKLEVKDLCYSYHSMDGETQALSDISLTVPENFLQWWDRPAVESLRCCHL